ncbi:ABC transporter substrate-binding protein [Aliiroseovarius crassostreae]|uniref:ABC transporter substrate-binding protein n=1 Tax=Aliiroseovarius crassostreae TaxID=154981 RepID=UPI003C7D87E1
MRKLMIGAVLGAAMLPGLAAAEDCGEVSITEMNWASSAIVTQVAKFLLEQGYKCTVQTVPSSTVPAVTSLAENGEPDIVTEMWTNGGGPAYLKLRDEGRVAELAPVLDPGGVEGWWIPTWLAEEHPELKTIEGVLANPELVDGRFNNCPEGWGCRILNDNLARALNVADSGIEIFNHGSGETLATSIASAFENKEPWFGYYWAPTKVLGKYEMTKVELGPVDPEIHARNQEKDRDAPEISDFPPSPVWTVVTKEFEAEKPAISAMLSKLTFDVDAMSSILAWQDENGASAEEAAVNFLLNNKDVWADWLDDTAKGNLSKILN